ncbi:MAG: hypothetical protein WKG07_48990 [Hymenobacter sp.]
MGSQRGGFPTPRRTSSRAQVGALNGEAQAARPLALPQIEANNGAVRARDDAQREAIVGDAAFMAAGRLKGGRPRRGGRGRRATRRGGLPPPRLPHPILPLSQPLRETITKVYPAV